MVKPIKLAKADMPPESMGTAVATPVAPASKPVAEDMSAPVWKTHTVVAGDTLDKLVQKYYANSPLKAEVLRDWVVVNNPKAFTKVNSKKLQPGTVLNLADQAELIQKLMPGASSKSSANSVPNSPSPNPFARTCGRRCRSPSGQCASVG
jgi:Tfp pilus assembly protein FimV